MIRTKKIIWIIGILLCLLVGGFFIFRYLMPNEVMPDDVLDDVEPEPAEIIIENQPGLVITRVDESVEKNLSVEIGQMLMIGFRGLDAGEDSYIDMVIQDIGIGGVILFDYDVPSKRNVRNIENKERLKSLIADLQSFSSIPLFVAVDAEGGKINRLKEEYGFISMPSHEELGKGELSDTSKAALQLGKQLKELGFNMDMAPVVDVNINPENPIIGKLGRAFSADPMQVTWHAKEFIESLRGEGIIAVIKHFPGHGSSVGDSHLGLVDVTETYQPAELFPYHLLQSQGVMDAVMTAHIINKNVDEIYPATLSDLFIEGILRRQVKFDGVVISDDMQMASITENFGLEEAIVRAINAGSDIILLSNNSPSQYDEQLPYEVRDIIVKAVAEGRITEQRILQAFSRINNLKKEFEIITLKVAE